MQGATHTRTLTTQYSRRWQGRSPDRGRNLSKERKTFSSHKHTNLGKTLLSDLCEIYWQNCVSSGHLRLYIYNPSIYGGPNSPTTPQKTKITPSRGCFPGGCPILHTTFFPCFLEFKSCIPKKRHLKSSIPHSIFKPSNPPYWKNRGQNPAYQKKFFKNPAFTFLFGS